MTGLAVRQTGSDVHPGQQRRSVYGALPLSFEPNVGQADVRVNFLAHIGGGSLLLTPTESVLSGPAGAVHLRFDGANPAPAVSGAEALSGRVNYLRGADPAGWRTDVPTFGRVEYHGVYPGIDVAYHGSAGQLEYDFTVAPRAEPDAIAMSTEGAGRARVDNNGDLVLPVGATEVRQHRPVAFQDVDGTRTTVAVAYQLGAHGQIGFTVGHYDRSRPLVIDPLVYSSYLGGTGGTLGTGIAVDTSGNAYVTGHTFSADFPTTPSPLQSARAGSDDAFVSKVNPSGSALVYSTYLGGSAGDQGNGIAVDTTGNAYVVGTTSSADFPAASAFPGETLSAFNHVFIAKLNVSGSALIYSKYLGGNNGENGNGIGLDASGNAYVTGTTASVNFATTAGVFQGSYGTNSDAFVTKVNPTGSALVYSSFLGGSGHDEGLAIAVDGSGAAYVGGRTASDDFPTSALGFQRARGNGGGGDDGFVTKIGPDGSSLPYSTYLGGNSSDIVRAIAVDGAGSAYVTGGTASTNFPLAGSPMRSVFTGINGDAFVTKLNTTGSGLVYSTYLGGGDIDTGRAITVDGSGAAHVAGDTLSSDFPTVDPVQTFKKNDHDAFVTHLNASGSAALFSTFLGSSGGSGLEKAASIAIDASGNDYVTGNTDGTDFPTAGPPFQATPAGGFVAKLGMGGAAPAHKPPADFNGDGTTDVSVFRPSGGQWLVNGQSSPFFGLNGDIPVPCDYNHDGTVDKAVFRPSSGGWYINGVGGTVFFGLPGDIPVPGDYDGDGFCDIAVYRPSVGGWYIKDQSTTFFGLNGDIPVPGDYNGDGKTDIAVFRPSVGGWYINGQPTTFFGLNGDIPVPGDYNGDGKTDIAVFRPSVGGWYVNGSPTTFLGLNGDIPQPGDYDGNGTTDVAVYRPSSGQWFVQGQSTVFFGLSTDLPLPLPSAIRMAAFP